MKTVSLLLIFAFMLFTLAAAAQSNSAPSSSTSSQSSGVERAPDSAQAGNTGSQTGAGSNGNIVEGCVVQVEKDYFLQPVSGGNRLRLRGNHDFTSDVGHSVRAEGTIGPTGGNMSDSAMNANPSSAGNANPGTDTTSTNSASAQSPSAEQSSSSSPANSNTQDFMVSRITTVSQSCPSNQSAPPSTLNNPH